jgi:hypothetical protein
MQAPGQASRPPQPEAANAENDGGGRKVMMFNGQDNDYNPVFNLTAHPTIPLNRTGSNMKHVRPYKKKAKAARKRKRKLAAQSRRRNG